MGSAPVVNQVFNYCISVSVRTIGYRSASRLSTFFPDYLLAVMVASHFAHPSGILPSHSFSLAAVARARLLSCRPLCFFRYHSRQAQNSAVKCFHVSQPLGNSSSGHPSFSPLFHYPFSNSTPDLSVTITDPIVAPYSPGIAPTLIWLFISQHSHRISSSVPVSASPHHMASRANYAQGHATPTPSVSGHKVGLSPDMTTSFPLSGSSGAVLSNRIAPFHGYAPYSRDPYQHALYFHPDYEGKPSNQLDAPSPRPVSKYWEEPLDCRILAPISRYQSTSTGFSYPQGPAQPSSHGL